MQKYIQTFERFLGLHKLENLSEKMSARAVYIAGLTVIFCQLVNQVLLYLHSTDFTYERRVSLTTILVMTGIILLLRKTTNFMIFAGLYSSLIVLGVFAAAIPTHIGINTALLPSFIAGIILNGLICTWRSTVVFGTISLMSIWILWAVSATHLPIGAADPAHYTQVIYMRAVQASLSIITITLVGGVFSWNMHFAFKKLTDNVETAKASDRAKSKFLATMGHELYTPMNGIIGITEVLLETPLTVEQKKLAKVVQSSGTELQRTIDNVLLFSLLDTDKATACHEAYNLSATLILLAARYDKAAQKKGLVLNIELPENVPEYIIGDQKRIQQLVAALLNNAIKFTNSGTITIRLKGTKSAENMFDFQILVQDTGIGIAPEHADYIFEPFTQVDNSIQRQHTGAGLGLTNAQGLAALMGGRLDMISAEGQGSAFTLSLSSEIVTMALSA